VRPAAFEPQLADTATKAGFISQPVEQQKQHDWSKMGQNGWQCNDAGVCSAHMP